jgi:hypothetical protein
VFPVRLEWIFVYYLEERVNDRAHPRGGVFEYLHRSAANRRRRRKRNPVPGGITGPPCSWGI